MEIIKLREDYIKLGQALKAAGLVESGVDAKYAIEDGLVKVNNETAFQRGKKLVDGCLLYTSRIHSHPVTTPIIVLHPTEIHTAFSTPGSPVILIKGENAKESKVGAMVLLIMEQIPKVAPRIAPASGPSKTAPNITGMCTVVALITGSWIIPNGVFANRITTAIISATLASQRVSFFFLFNFLSSCYCSYIRYNAMLRSHYKHTGRRSQ